MELVLNPKNISKNVLDMKMQTNVDFAEMDIILMLTICVKVFNKIDVSELIV